VAVKIPLVMTDGEIEQLQAGDSISGAVSSIPTGNTVWVDEVNGDDGTGTSGRQDLPFLTVSASLAVAGSGDTVIVRPGVYFESGLTIPSGVSLIGQGSWEVTTIGDYAAAADCITLSDEAMIRGVRVRVPTSSSFAGLTYNGVGGTLTAAAYDLQFQGDASTGAGIGMKKTGLGKIIAAELRFDYGGVGIGMLTTAGTIAAEGIHFPPTAGSFATGVRAEGTTGRLQLADFNVGNGNIVDAIEVDGDATVLVFGVNITNATNMVHVESDGVTVGLFGGKMVHGAGGFDFLLDPGLTGVNSLFQVTTSHSSDYSFPPAALQSDFEIAHFQEGSDIERPQFTVFGPEVSFGFPEKGASLNAGRGRSYVKGMRVFTTDGTAAPGSDGANFVEETGAAQSISGSTFGFQGTTAGHSIAFTTTRVDQAGTPLPYWGIAMFQTVGSTGGSYVFEVRIAANTWRVVGFQAVSIETDFRYGEDVFLRAATTGEDIRFGVFGGNGTADPVLPDGTAWPVTTHSGIQGRWARVRITSNLTTGPTFERMKISPSHCEFNQEGERVAHGLALWRTTISAGGNIFGESGGVVTSNIPVGSGGLPTGWNQIAPNARLNNNGDAIYFQFALQDGICTAYPITMKVVYSLQGSQPVTAAPQGILSFLPTQVSGARVADPAGGLVPVPRTLANTELLTAKAGQSDTQNLTAGAALPATLDNRAHEQEFGPFSISSYYEDDLCFVRFEMDNDGAPNQDVTVWALIISGVAFSEGAPI